MVGHGLFGESHSLKPSVTKGDVAKVVQVNGKPVMIQVCCLSVFALQICFSTVFAWSVAALAFDVKLGMRVVSEHVRGEWRCKRRASGGSVRISRGYGDVQCQVRSPSAFRSSPFANRPVFCYQIRLKFTLEQQQLCNSLRIVPSTIRKSEKSNWQKITLCKYFMSMCCFFSCFFAETRNRERPFPTSICQCQLRFSCQ